jgi:hypothetical protein
MVGLLNALPDTQLWRRLEKEGRLLGESSGNNTNCSLNFIPKMDPARLIEGYQAIMQTIYKPSEYYQRSLDSLRRTAGQLPAATRFQFKDITSFAHLLFKLGVLDRERREFWRFFAKASAHHRDKFIEAMRFAAVGYHFRKLNEAYSES